VKKPKRVCNKKDIPFAAEYARMYGETAIMELKTKGLPDDGQDVSRYAGMHAQMAASWAYVAIGRPLGEEGSYKCLVPIKIG
jgi:hypothetical protein